MSGRPSSKLSLIEGVSIRIFFKPVIILSVSSLPLINFRAVVIAATHAFSADVLDTLRSLFSFKRHFKNEKQHDELF